MLPENTNNLLDANEQTHIDAIRNQTSNQTEESEFPTLPGQHTNAWELLKHKLANADYNKIFEQFAIGVTTAHIAYAIIKLSKYIAVLGYEAANDITTILMMFIFLAVAMLVGKHNHGILFVMAVLTIITAQTI